MLAGGVALAAGRFQPLVRFEPWKAAATAPEGLAHGRAGRYPGFSTVLSLAEARSFARRLEDRAAAVVADYRRLGDDCDFLTLAGEWPYRYLNDRETGRARGEAALDDLVGRILEPELANLGKSRDRWAYAGRLLGNPSASVYRAMCALFLPPDSAILWNTYGSNEPWNYYGMNRASEVLSRSIRGPLRHRAGTDANLPAWHRLAAGPGERTRLVFFNSSGDPKRFAIDGGAGRPADIPPGGPSAVVIIHSFSAADPTDPRTIAGRWLALGAFVYYGSMNEPYLNAFRPPSLEAGLLAAGVPLVAALREGPAEPFGQPWRLVYLGDPLYRLDVHAHRQEGSESSREAVEGSARLDPRRWKPPLIDDLDRFSAGVVRADFPSPGLAEPGTVGGTTLHWCLNAAIAGACNGESSGLTDSDRTQHPDWRRVLESIPRDRLPAGDRPIWDALVIDAILKPADGRGLDFWFERLGTIPAAEWSPKLEAMQEYATVHRLATSAGRDDFNSVLARWDEAIRRSWPKGSEFPAQLTGRVGAMAGTADRLRRWRDRLRGAEAALPDGPAVDSQRAIVEAERKRVESELAKPR
jgi:hypothetical protein